MLLGSHFVNLSGSSPRLIQDSYLAQELAQETMLHAYLSLADLRDAARFRSWLYGIAI